MNSLTRPPECGPMPAGWFYRLTLAVIALAAALAIGPSSARAACGDYVVVVGAAPVHADHPPAPAPGPTCHGCSRAPTQAAPVTSPTVVERPTPVATLVDESPAPPATSPVRSGCAPAVPTRLPSDIFHPPRAS